MYSLLSCLLFSQAPRNRKDVKAHVGWLHCDRRKYTQVKILDGGGNREIKVDDDSMTAETLLQKTCGLFFPNGESVRKGRLDEMDVALGNFAQEHITEFTDIHGNSCGMKEYLSSRGLYISKSYFYLMTRPKVAVGKTSGYSSNNESSKGSEIEVGDNIRPSQGDEVVETVAEETQYSSQASSKGSKREALQNLEPFKRGKMTETKTMPHGAQDTKYFVPLFEGCVKGYKRPIDIKYTRSEESSYSEEVICSASCYSRAGCLEFASVIDPDIMIEGLDGFCPMDHDFYVSRITLEGKDYFDCGLTEEENIQAKGELMMWDPSTLWGYDGHELILAAVSGCENVMYSWYLDDTELCTSSSGMCIAVKREGSYKCIITKDDNVSISKSVRVMGADETYDAACKQSGSIPVIEAHVIQFAREEKDVLGEGSFGKVYKGSWKGTNIAVKEIQTQVRGRKQQEAVIENEIQIHSRIRHPSIVQIMAVAYTKKSVLLVSEYIPGPNLEEAIFGEDQKLLGGIKDLYAKQICQAVAYLHGRNPQIIHHDIKPSNILINHETATAKVCDLGISKVKILGSATATCANGVPGTLMYMAPECILERRPGAPSDIWALGCTLLELFTEQDTWDLPAGVDPLEFLTGEMKAFRQPPRVNSINRARIKDCFNYDRTKRPSAKDLIEIF